MISPNFFSGEQEGIWVSISTNLENNTDCFAQLFREKESAQTSMAADSDQRICVSHMKLPVVQTVSAELLSQSELNQKLQCLFSTPAADC